MKLPAAHRLMCTFVLALFVIATFAPSIVYAEAKAPDATEEAPAKAEKDTPHSPPPAAANSRADCERYMAILSGKKKGSIPLDDPQLKAAANGAPDLVTCGAVVADSAELCGLLSAPDDCRRLQSVFHELKTNPNGRGFLMSDEEYAECRKGLPEYSLDPSMCDVFREAARAGDPSKCPPQGKVEGMEGWCKAIVGLDKSKCVGIGGVDDKEQGKKACEKIIDRNEHFAKGLDELAKSGSTLERALASATLGKADACKGFETAAMKACVVEDPTPKAASPQNEPQDPPAPEGTPPAAS